MCLVCVSLNIITNVTFCAEQRYFSISFRALQIEGVHEEIHDRRCDSFHYQLFYYGRCKR